MANKYLIFGLLVAAVVFGGFLSGCVEETAVDDTNETGDGAGDDVAVGDGEGDDVGDDNDTDAVDNETDEGVDNDTTEAVADDDINTTDDDEGAADNGTGDSGE